MKNIIVFIGMLVILTSSMVNAQTTNSNGSWTGGNWDNGVPADDGVSTVNHVLSVDTDFKISGTGACTVNGTLIDATGGSDYKLDVENSGELTVNGTTTLGSNLTVKNSANIIISACNILTVGDMKVSNNVTFSIASCATLIVNGDLEIENNIEIECDGDIIVNGNVIAKNNATITGAGTLSTTGTVDIINSASIFGSTTSCISGPCLFDSPGTGGTHYTTIASGNNYNNAISWDANGVPPSTLPNGDYITLNHQINLNIDINILGLMTIGSSGSLIGNKKINVGKGSSNQGELINQGILTIKELKAEPDGCIAPVDAYPIIHNYGIINADKVDVGKGCESGQMTNHNDPNGLGAGVINVSGEFHIDGVLCNENNIFIQGKLKIHGGSISCCGRIETPLIEFDKNNGSGFGARPGTSDCQDYCTAYSTEPILKIKSQGNVTSTVLFTNPDPSESIVTSNTTFCANFQIPIADFSSNNNAF
ncbi:MAG: hypothetical protein HRT72_00095, partial [Flavobacteriales bacterium]|nr:hypothetical protein [Flavobacteriales bacterium]